MLMGESLVNLVNNQQFAKLKPSKLVVTNNNLLADLFINQTFFAKIFIYPLSPHIITTKLSLYMVLGNNFNTKLSTLKCSPSVHSQCNNNLLLCGIT